MRKEETENVQYEVGDLKVIVAPYETVKQLGEEILNNYKEAFEILKDK